MSMLHEESLLSKETLLELRSEQFNLKRWVSRAMAEAKRNATSASPQPSGLSSGSSPHSPSSPTAPPPTKASAAAGAAAVTDEVVAQQLSTVLGVRKQSAAEGLEETISSALRNLPRATEDVSRLVTESSAMRTKLRDVATSTAKVRDSSSVSEKLRELHEVRNRLITCRTVLNDAQLLASRAAGVEQAITNLYGGSLPNTIASPPTNSTQRGTQRAPTLDMAESNRIADDIAAMRAALRTLQEIDPTYGSSLRTQVDRFEQMMLKGLEAQCLDALKREDKATSPALLAALKKIGREAGVMKQHTDALVAVRIDKFKLEVTAHSGPSVGDKHLPSLRRCLHSLVKALTKDKAFLDEVLASHEASSAAAQVDANFLVTVCERVGSELAAVIPTYTNEGLMTALDIVQQEFTTPLTSGHLASTSTLHCVTSLVNPFVSATTRFADSEIAQIEARASSSKAPGDLHKLEEDLKSSARRVTSYLGALCHFGVHLPAAVQQAKAAMTKCFAAWNKAGLQFASAVGASLPKPAVVGAGSAATRAALESSVAFHAQCGDLQAHVTRLRSELTELVQGVAGPLDISAHTANNFFAPAAAAIADLPTTCRNNVLSTVLEPVKAMLPTKASVAAGTAIAGSQSESVRALGEWVMELPMTLDGAGVVADVQDWVAAAVVYLLKLYSTAVRGILTAPQPAAVPTAASGAPLSTGSTTTGVTKSVSDQLLADIEYLETVVNAIDETPANSQIFTELRQAVATATTS